MTITITKKHIKDAAFCQKNSLYNNCAVALALEEQFGKATVSCMIHLEQQGFWCPLPDHIKEWVQKFDEATPIERLLMPPVSFELEVGELV